MCFSEFEREMSKYVEKGYVLFFRSISDLNDNRTSITHGPGTETDPFSPGDVGWLRFTLYRINKT